MRLRRLRRDDGSASIELAIVAPAVLTMLAFAIIAGRGNLAQQAVESAAFDAARSASLARTEDAARGDASSAARSTLSSLGVACRNISVTVDTGGFRRPVGQPATVSATVSCRADFSDVVMPGLPGSKRLSASFTSPLDTYRSRQ